MKEGKRILILTYYWPPSGGGGVQRWMYFAKYLKESGFNPTVITVHPDKASYPLIDRSQLEMVKDIETIYTNTMEPLKLYSLLKSGKSDRAIPYGNLGEKNSGLFGKIMAFVRSNFFVPDARKGWVPYAQKAASKKLSSETFDWIITTGPPHSTHLAGKYLSEKFKVKWLADFRDPWSEIYFLQNTKRLDFAVKKDQRLEQEVLSKADVITTVGPGMAKLLSRKIKHPDKLQILYNGYDQEMLDGIERNENPNALFTISHVGLLGETQKFNALIEAIAISEIPASKIKIHLAGTVYSGHLEMLKSKLPDIELVRQDFIPRKDALSLMLNSDLLPLCPPMVGETALIVSTKTMEYLASSTPIIGIGDPESDAAFLVKQQSMSGFFAPDNVEAMSKFIQRCYKNWVSGNKLVNDFDPEPYSRYAVSQKLIQLLNSEG